LGVVALWRRGTHYKIGTVVLFSSPAFFQLFLKIMNKQSSSKASLLCLRHVALASALCCAGLAQAQTDSSVTLYGLADVGITSVSGLKAGTVTQVASGIMEGSRWGIKGTEDLGGGYKAIFNLEARVELDTGASSTRPISGTQLPDRLTTVAGLNAANPTTLLANMPLTQNLVAGASGANGLGTQLGVNLTQNVFDRPAYVGMITPFGGFLAGRMYTPAFETNSMFDIMETQSGLAAGQIVAYPAALEIRASNALAYRFVKDGISGSLMYAAGEVAGDAGKNRLLGLNASYKTSNFAVGFGYNTKNNEKGDKSLTTSVLGASMNLGASSKLSSMIIKIKDDNPSGLTGVGSLLLAGAGITSTTPNYSTVYLPAALAVESAYTSALKQDGTLFHIGYRNVTGPHTISVAYNKFNDNRAYNADVASYGAAYTYALSKRTDLNAVVVRYNNENTAQVAPGGNGYIGGYTKSAGTDSTGLAFGIRHRF
jgi:predicted porin